jgi:hypothetical protein
MNWAYNSLLKESFSSFKQPILIMAHYITKNDYLSSKYIVRSYHFQYYQWLEQLKHIGLSQRNLTNVIYHFIQKKRKNYEK